MKKASEYRQYAEECRALAFKMVGEQRTQMLEMAETWERLAAERLKSVRKDPDAFVAGDYETEVE